MKVTATFDVAAKLAPQLAELLRVMITPQFPCTLIGVMTDEQGLHETKRQEPIVERDGLPDGKGVPDGDDGKNRKLGRASGEDAKKPVRRRTH